MGRIRRNPPEWMGMLEEGKRYSVSSTPISTVRDTSADQEVAWKPKGLWYGCGDAWVDWLESEMPEWLDRVLFVYEVIPNMSRVIELNTVDEIREFDEQFGQVDRYSRRGTDYVRWPAVARFADGIEICPYQWRLRDSEVGWYATWDVASGCIWRPSGVKELRLIAQR